MGRTLAIVLIVSLCGCALSGSAALRRFKPTKAEPASEALDPVLQATLRELVVAKGLRLSRLRKQPYVVVMADSDYITAAILPTLDKLNFLVLTPEQVSQIASWNGDFLYVRMELRALSQSDATVLFEVVETSFDCCSRARRDSVLANLQLTTEDGWKVKQVIPFTNPAYFKASQP
ncbi:MAG: hypothetical protein SF187_27680 [Deltaproteobacteria bacterium]|nr:hypothetical protein [Deltaproteobacteria bacterium]